MLSLMSNITETPAGILYGEHKRGHLPEQPMAPETLRGSHILKRGALLREPCYPAHSLVLVGGLPGAGKSTLIDRCLDAADDAQPMMALSVAKMVERDGGDMGDVTNKILQQAFEQMLTEAEEAAPATPVIIEATSFSLGMRTSIHDLAVRTGREAQLLMIQATGKQAASGLRARGYQLDDDVWRNYVRSAGNFDKMLKNYPDHLDDEGWASVLLSSRYAASKISKMVFTAE